MSSATACRLLFAYLCTVAVGCGEMEYYGADSWDATQRLTDYLDSVMASRPIPGLAVAIVKDSSVIFARGFGVKRLGSPEAVTPATLFHTASVSKAFVATAILQQVGTGLLELDAPVTRYLPYFRLSDARQGEITLRHILSHTSGLPDVTDYGWESPEVDEGALERYVRGLESVHLETAPGARWKYSNLAFEVLGDVVAKAAGVPFETAIDSSILAPLGMLGSSFLPIAHPTGDQASPHRGALSPVIAASYPYTRVHAPSSTLRSSALDLARFVVAMFGDDRRDVLADSLRDTMWRRHAEVDRGLDMGLGWFIRSHRGNRMVLAPGRDPGFNAIIALIPSRNVGLAILTNYDGQSSFELVEIADGLFDIGLGRTPTLPKASIAVPVARVVTAFGVDSAIAEYRRLRAAGDTRYQFGMSDLITLGHDLRTTGRVEDAIRFYQLNAEEHPDYFASHLSLASAYLLVADTNRAVASYRRMLAMNPERYGCPESCYRDPRLDALLARQ